MPKVEHRKARKDYPAQGIKAGEMYYFCEMKTGPRSSKTMRSKTPFKRWELTTSEYLSTLWQIEDRITEFAGDYSDLEDIIAELEQLRDETQEKFDNMPEGLQQGDSGQTLEQRVSELDDLITTLQGIDEPEEPESDEDDEDEGSGLEDDPFESFREEVRNAL
ncbi:hypothetical protein Pan1_72 [Pseudanabaena phage Pan1]|nr:hypothetical protein Pan1_72 [Pseudanabaena phage Pan1]